MTEQCCSGSVTEQTSKQQRAGLKSAERRRKLRAIRDQSSSSEDIQISETEESYEPTSSDESNIVRGKRFVSAVQTSGRDFHPILQAILDGDYTCFTTPERETRVYGDFQLVGSVLHFNGPRAQLYRMISILFPWIKLSYDSFRKRTETIFHTKNRTDLCSVCFIYESFSNEMRKKESKSEEKTPNEKKFEALFQEHVYQYQVQRRRMRENLSSLQESQRLVLMDYKENYKLPITKNQEGRAWYNKTQCTCLSFLVYQRASSGVVNKTVLTYLSPCLSHTGSFTLLCLERVLKDEIFQGCTEVILWSDGGPHFRCKEVVGRVLSDRFSTHYGMRFVINYFAPSHGKSEIDSVFGLFSRIVKDYMPVSTLRDSNDLCEFFKSKFTQLQIGMKHCQRTYKFQTFAQFLPTSSYNLLLFLFSLWGYPTDRIGYPRTEESLQRLKLVGFKRYLSFAREGSDLVASRPTVGRDDIKDRFPFSLEEIKQEKKRKQEPEEEPKEQSLEYLVAEQITYLLKQFK